MSMIPGGTGTAASFPDGFTGSQLANVETISATKVLVTSDRKTQLLTPSGALRVAQLPATALLGEQWVFICSPSAAFSLQVNSSNGSQISLLAPGESVSINAGSTTPVANTDWIAQVPTTILSNGSVSTPALRFTGSGSDTGIYSPSTDAIAFSNAGVQSLLVNSVGAFTLGTSTASGSAAIQESEAAASFGTLKVANRNASASETSLYWVHRSDGTNLNAHSSPGIQAGGAIWGAGIGIDGNTGAFSIYSRSGAAANVLSISQAGACTLGAVGNNAQTNRIYGFVNKIGHDVSATPSAFNTFLEIGAIGGLGNLSAAKTSSFRIGCGFGDVNGFDVRFDQIDSSGGSVTVGTVGRNGGSWTLGNPAIGFSALGSRPFTISTSPVVIAAAGVGTMVFISGYNNSGGAQGWWLIASISNTTPTVIASNNSTSLTVTFSTSAQQIRMQTSSGTLIAQAQALGW
jgi:hypothetical protein